LAKVNPNKLFKIPRWIPRLPDPITPPTYQQITNIIRKMKTSGSPCPLDQISIICFKRCPYLWVIHKSSTSQSITHLWKSTHNHTNMQYDQYSSTKEVLKSFRQDQEDKLNSKLLHQGSFLSSIFKFSLSKLNTIWSTCQSKLPKNIFNFTIRYINNSLPTRKNLTKWGVTASSECSFCFYPETLSLYMYIICSTGA
jgi:hypothetical protein